MEVSIKVTNNEDINYIHSLQNNKNDILSTALSIGIKAISMTNIQMNGCSYYEPIKNIIDDKLSDNSDDMKYIISILDDLMNIKQNSSRKGKLGESLAINSLIKKYPSWEICNISGTGHEGDCCVYSDKYGKILYEFKTYTSNVSKDEIIKFKKDVDATNSLYGIFVSHTSGIVGKKMIDIELYNNKILIYVSNSGLNGHGIELATELLLQLINNNSFNNNNFILKSNNHQILIKELNDIMNELQECNNNFSRLSSQIIESKHQISQIIDHLYKKTFDYHLKGTNLMNKMIIMINDNKIDDTKTMTILDNISILKFINTISNEDHKYMVQKIYEISSINNLSITINDSNDIIYFINKVNDTNKLIGKLLIKNKLELLFTIQDKTNISINGNYEKIKNNEYISIQINKDPNLWELISNRFTLFLDNTD